jgi:hypothetical protein
MRYGSLDDPIAKLQRAAEHYLLIKNALGGRDHQLIPLRVISSENGLKYEFFAEDVPALPASLSLMLGDAYYNARAALDYLVFQLHIRHYRGPVPLSIIRKPAFPIYDQPQQHGPGQWDGIKRLAKKERTAIERLQPYNQRPGPLYGIREHLFDISRINNYDKHRQLHLTRSLAQAVPTLDSLSQYGLQHHPEFGKPIESGSLIDTWTFDRVPPEESMRRRNWKFRSGATFEIDGRNIDLMPNLGGSIHVVAQVINRFSRLFPPPNVALDLSLVRPVEPLL